MFIKPAGGEGIEKLHSVAQIVQTAFEQHGITSGESKTFVPHLTVMKMSKADPRIRRKGVRRINPTHYSSFVDHEFGTESISKLQLCHMAGVNQETGYYRCAHEIHLCDQATTVPESVKEQVCASENDESGPTDSTKKTRIAACFPGFSANQTDE